MYLTRSLEKNRFRRIGIFSCCPRRVKGDLSAKDSADELEEYCHRHLKNGNNAPDDLYRIFYYDCIPTGSIIYHPYSRKHIDYKKTDLYKWMTSFIEEIKKKRKFAVRYGWQFWFIPRLGCSLREAEIRLTQPNPQ
ncbi:MAG: hypothetical protein PUB69_00625 [Desulfovibrionaceae bacterium]|nr:hypothetical protein [Desulfovibrionaceae bacterium]